MQYTIQHIAQQFNIPISSATHFLSKFSKVELLRGTVFQAAGKTCHSIGLIESGLMKCVFHKDGEEVVFEFAYENQFIADYYSFVTQQPSEKEIVCLEDAIVYVIDRETLRALAEDMPFVEDMNRKMNEFLFLKMHDRLKSQLLHTSTERYEQLIAERQDLANRIPQYLLASYVAVAPETLSRIRKKLASR
ncbi:CRP-like cAMP-binding protein [Chitinophaga skermanii]|uniref:CRP-like cAMP-binding protein n=1 Tax=Chitinophaga skermanii TaxID=331697 RepID=A0A327R220_9BACT|nr:Crp/Fnr family transcriptional regulator [Chitinophaga skermanii]RAJ10681.1 CRP-like cAMP-binding protein [Chitinophaga skermanii]